MTSRFITLPDSVKKEAAKRKNSKYDPELKALADGETIFIEGWTPSERAINHIRSLLAYRTKRAKRLVTRSHSVDGKTGMAMWVEDRPR